MPDGWSDEELAAAVDAYNEMAQRDAESKPYSKREVYRALSARFGRSEKAFEYRMQNISSVLNEMGERWLPGLKPAANVGDHVKARIKTRLTMTASRRRPKAVSSGDYKEKLPAIRAWLIEIARAESTVQYGEAMKAFGIGFRNIRRVMDYLGHEAENLDEPVITALIVGPDGRCSDGFEKEFGISDDAGEREKLYKHWAETPNVIEQLTRKSSLELKAARFVSVEVRPSQAAFRRAVFLAHKGLCAISGCDVVGALDAAHKSGRYWREGHNLADDGYLLRKDLHALYDQGLIRITEAGIVDVDVTIHSHYLELNGRRVSSV